MFTDLDQAYDDRWARRTLVPVKEQRFDEPSKKGRFDADDQKRPEMISVLSYSVLSQERADPSLFPYADAATLNWRNRRDNIIK